MKKLLLSFAVFLFCVSIIAQTKVNLKLNLEKNKVYRFNSMSEQTIAQTINGNQQTTDSKTNHTVSIKMIDSTSAFMITEVRFDTLTSNTNAMGKMIKVSSAVEGDIKSKETAEIMSCIMNRLSKNLLYAKLDYTGKVIEIVNSKMLSDIIMQDTSSITLIGPVGSAVKGQIQSLLSDATLKTMVEAFTHFLPGREIPSGESWNITEQANSGGMILDIITDYHLDGVNGNAASLTAESNIKAAENTGPMMSGGAKITYDDVKGLSKSNIVIDILTGLVIEEKAKTHISGNLGVSMPGMSMQIPMDINGTSKIIALQ